MPPPAPVAWAALPLVALAGCVDAIGFLRLDQLFISFISGTSTLLGLAVAEGERHRAAELGLAVVLFAAGAVTGSVLARLAGERWRAPVVLLAAVAAPLGLAASWPAAALPDGFVLGLPAEALLMVPAMGALNTALPGVGGITFVTGALTRFAEALVAALAGQGRHRAWMVQLGAWMSLVGGVIAGGVMEARWGGDALAAPALAAALAGMVALAASWRRAARDSAAPRGGPISSGSGRP